MRKIALEEHFLPPDLASYGQAAHLGADRETYRGFEERLLDFGPMRLEAMDAAGIDVAVLSVTTPGVHAEPDTAVAIRRAKIANDFLARQIHTHPKRYAGFAHLPLQDPKAAADELERCVHQLEFKGAMVNGHTNGRYLDERDYDPFWERAQALGAPIYLHPRDPQDPPRNYHGHPELLGPTWGWTVETATHALRLVFGGVFDRYPGLTLILGHMGETLPYLLWRLDSRARAQTRAGEASRRLPSEIIRKNIIVTTSGVCSSPALLCAIAALGEDNVMFSVDYPFEDCRVAAAFIESAEISEATRVKICHANAERLLRL
jgi:2,3-dihydroxybenzoate decarboxylase